MVISSLNIKLIEDRIGFINKAVAKLQGISTLGEDNFIKERRFISHCRELSKAVTGGHV